MKNCPFCNEPINDDALKCPSCRQWLVDTTKLKKKKSIFPWLIGLLIIICLYHGLVLKAMRSAEVRECFKFRDLPEEYGACKIEITYWDTFFDFKRILQALD